MRMQQVKLTLNIRYLLIKVVSELREKIKRYYKEYPIKSYGKITNLTELKDAFGWDTQDLYDEIRYYDTNVAKTDIVSDPENEIVDEDTILPLKKFVSLVKKELFSK